MESNCISIFGVNISSNELGQVTLQNFDKTLENRVPPLWLHHFYGRQLYLKKNVARRYDGNEKKKLIDSDSQILLLYFSYNIFTKSM